MANLDIAHTPAASCLALHAASRPTITFLGGSVLQHLFLLGWSQNILRVHATYKMVNHSMIGSGISSYQMKKVAVLITILYAQTNSAFAKPLPDMPEDNPESLFPMPTIWCIPFAIIIPATLRGVSSLDNPS